MRGRRNGVKVALTIWNGRISPVFDVCQEALVVEIESGAAVSSSMHGLEGGTDLDRVGRLAGMGVETLICGAISRPLHRELLARHVDVIGFVAGEVDAVLAAFLAGRLAGRDFAMPGCRGLGRRNRCRRGRPGGW
jgi:predicted Fe-Mo cluster-binding NifX family protein